MGARCSPARASASATAIHSEAASRAALPCCQTHGDIAGSGDLAWYEIGSPRQLGVEPGEFAAQGRQQARVGAQGERGFAAEPGQDRAQHRVRLRRAVAGAQGREQRRQAVEQQLGDRVRCGFGRGVRLGAQGGELCCD